MIFFGCSSAAAALVVAKIESEDPSATCRIQVLSWGALEAGGSKPDIGSGPAGLQVRIDLWE